MDVQIIQNVYSLKMHNMKSSNLLLGNGVNINSNVFFRSEEINKRIEKTIENGIYFLGLQYNLNFLGIIRDNFDFSNNLDNVEVLLGKLFKVVIENKQDYFKQLTEKKFLEVLTLLKIIIINAIFTVDNQLIKLDIPEYIVDKINSYDKIFSLNYFEFWDKTNKSIHLHGKIRYQRFDRDDFTIDKNREKYYINYASAIDDLLSEKFYFPIVNIDEIIMLPIGYKINKQRINEIQNKYDQFGFVQLKKEQLDNVQKLYEQLNNLEDISLFGVSPFGDKTLIDKLSIIPNVTIYVYNLDENDIESNEWKKILPNAKLIDSKYFK